MAGKTKRDFKMAPELLYHVIHSQAGSQAKAILELIMNSIDAGGDGVTIDINQKGFKVVDSGKGFTSMQEIERFFETFGTPHKEGDATYGKFRMGRGQIFAFSHNFWHTGAFKMAVDIKNKGLEYELHDDPNDQYDGCSIEGVWYDKLKPSDLATIIRDVSELARYAPVPVTINDAQINKIPSRMKWQHNTDQAYVNIRETGSLKVYNLGVLVREYPNYTFGVGGVVVSKEQLEVNFARNDILISKCKVWKSIKPFLETQGMKSLSSNTRMNNEQRLSLAMKIMDGSLTGDHVANMKLITDTRGRHSSIQDFFQTSASQITVSPSRGDRVADTIATRGLAYCLSPDTLERFNVDSIGELIDRLAEKMSKQSWSFHPAQVKSLKEKIVPFEKVGAAINSSYLLLKDSELKPTELELLRSMRKSMKPIASAVARVTGTNTRYRKIMIGESDCAHAWTDGNVYIAINRNQLQEIRKGMGGAIKLTNIVLHEYLHNAANLGSHQHDLEFYEAYHNAQLENYAPGYVPHLLMKDYAAGLEKKGLKVTRHMLHVLDTDTQMESLAEEVVDYHPEVSVAISESNTKDGTEVSVNQKRTRRQIDRDAAMSNMPELW